MDNDLLDALRLRNVDVLSTNEDQMSSRNDEKQLKWALLDNQRVIYSFNVRDFYRIHTNLVKQGDRLNSKKECRLKFGS